MPTNDRVVYLDSSALVKLVVREAESAALERFLTDHPQKASSQLALTEVVRAVLDQGANAITRAASVLAEIDLVLRDATVLERAGRLLPPLLRSLDAIHVATALELAAELGVLVTYDDRMANAAQAHSIPVAMPGRE